MLRRAAHHAARSAVTATNSGSSSSSSNAIAGPSSLKSILTTTTAKANSSRQHRRTGHRCISSSCSSTHSKALHTTSHLHKSTLPTPTSAAPNSDLLQVTTLSNGIKVATDGTPGHFVAAGVYVGAGSRFEHEGNAGSSHMIDRLAFKSTSTRTAEQMTNEIEALGGQFMASSSREVIMYQASSYTQSLTSVLTLLSDAVLNAKITPEEVDLQRQSAAYELQEIHNKPEMILPELLYEVAYQGNTLGNPLLMREDKLDSMDVATLKDFRRTWFRPDRMVVAGAGVSHDQMLELAEKLFGHLQPASSAQQPSLTSGNKQQYFTPNNRNIPSHLLPSNSTSPTATNRQLGKAPYATVSSNLFPAAPSFEELASARPVYTGGSVYDDSKASSMEFSHLYVAYEGLSIYDDDIYALATLQMLLGGGSSFSAGGPGKGMFSRLYTSLLNRYHDVEHCSAWHHCYIDSGLFAICISVNPHFIHRAPILIAETLDSLMLGPGHRRGLSNIELSRAKNQLKSSLVMALESRMVQAEDLGRQVLAHGHKLPADEMLSKIDAVTLDDLVRVARRIFRPQSSPDALRPTAAEFRSGEPTILAAGKLEGIPDVRDVLRKYGLTPN